MDDVERTSEEKWYSATALFKAVRPGEAGRRHLWERTTFLLRARNEASAQVKADTLARDMQHEYQATDGHMVRWQFESVEGLLQLMDDEIREGTEVCWEHFERVDKS